MGRRCQERPEEDETHKMDRTSQRSPQMEMNCWEVQESSTVVAPSKKKKFECLAPGSMCFRTDLGPLQQVPCQQVSFGSLPTTTVAHCHCARQQLHGNSYLWCKWRIVGAGRVISCYSKICC